MNRPNLIIAGVVKGGTTSLFSYLTRHSSVGASKIKEPGYFMPNSQMGERQYYDLFSGLDGTKYRVEASAGYLWGGRAVCDKIKNELGPNTKVILVLREPVERMISHYRFLKSMLLLPKDAIFSDYLKVCQRADFGDGIVSERFHNLGLLGGRYDYWLPPWIESFGDNLLITYFDFMKDDTPAWVASVSQWLGLDSNYFASQEYEVENKTVNFKFALAQRFALEVNSKLETMWRSHPKLKSSLRSMYYRFNGSAQKESIDTSSISQAKQYFVEPNQRLRQLLVNHGCGLVTWIENA